MTSEGFAAKGTLVYSVYGATRRAIMELKNISFPIGEASDIDITNHDSAFDYEELVAGPINGGEFTLEGNFLPGSIGQTTQLTYLQARYKTITFVIAGPAGKYMAFSQGFVKSFNVGATVNDVTNISITFKPKKKVTFYNSPHPGLTTPFFALRDNGGNAVTPTPAAAGDVYQYAATLDFTDTAVAIQPTAVPGAIWLANPISAAITTGNWSADIPVAAGTTEVLVLGVAGGTYADKIYRIHVSRPSS